MDTSSLLYSQKVFTNNERKYGIDLLRILLMFMIILGHLYVHTGIRDDVAFLSFKWNVIWFTQSVTVSAVNCFVIISGYFMWEKNCTIKKIVTLWGKVLFFSIIIFLVLVLSGAKKWSYSAALDAFFPVLRKEYWFFTEYLLLCLFSPIINIAIRYLSLEEHKKYSLLVVVIFYCLPLLAAVFPPIDNEGGYSFIGFITLYFVSAYISRANYKISQKKCILYLLVNNSVIFTSKILLNIIVTRLNLILGTSLLYHYNTVFQLINAILLVLLFKDFSLGEKTNKLVISISRLVFPVYLIHDNKFIREWIWNPTLYKALNMSNNAYFVVIIVFYTIFILLIGLLLGLIFETSIRLIVKRFQIISQKLMNCGI